MRIKMRERKTLKKAQAEIVGITIVMVLIMLGIIFVIKFVVLPDEYNIKQAFDQSQMAANFMDSVLKTTTTCNNLEVTELIQDCAENYGSSFLYTCPEDPELNITCNRTDNTCTSCEFLNQSIEYILVNSLNKMPQIDYDLFICKWNSANGECYDTFPGDIIAAFPDSNCTNNGKYPNGYEVKQQPIPTDVGNRIMQMFIC